jgi:hypothetical protein
MNIILKRFILLVLFGTSLGWATESAKPSIYVLADLSMADTSYASRPYFLDDKSKSPWHAFLVAFLPGSIIRGLGHHYADQHVVGFGLLGAEILGVKLIDDGMGDWFGPKEGNQTKLEIGLALFFGSWVFDFVRAPMLVDKVSRRKQDARLDDILINLEPTAVGIKLNLVKSF